MSEYSPVHTVLWLDIPVENLTRAISFYQAILDTQVLANQTNDSASFQYGKTGTGITLIKVDCPIAPASFAITPYLNCNGRLERAIAQAKLYGGDIVKNIHTMKPFGIRAIILDSEGNQIALHSVS